MLNLRAKGRARFRLSTRDLTLRVCVCVCAKVILASVIVTILDVRTEIRTSFELSYNMDRLSKENLTFSLHLMRFICLKLWLITDVGVGFLLKIDAANGKLFRSFILPKDCDFDSVFKVAPLAERVRWPTNWIRSW